jgi:hypothetical protein
MQSTLTIPKPSDDPHDVVVVAPDAVRVAPSDIAPDVAPPAPDDELSSLLQQAARQRAETPVRTAPDFAAAPTIPPVDAAFRPAAVDDILAPGRRRSLARRALRAFMTLLLAAGIVAVFALRSQGDAAKQMIAQWAPPFVLAWLPTEKPESAAPPAAPAVVQADAANTAAPQPAPAQPAPPAPQRVTSAAQPAAPAPAAAEAVAPAAVVPAPDTAQLQSMARDLASLGQEVVQLKASIEQLKAGQQQISRDAARASEQNLRAKVAALPSRPSAALPPRRRPMAPMPPPQAATASTLPPPAAAPYYAPPPAPPPHAMEQQLTDPELASVPRPPMPVR